MIMRQKKWVIALCVFLTVCFAISFFSRTLLGNVKRYELRPEITLPEYKTDIQRVMDSYERLMGNYIALTENNLSATRTEIVDIAKKLDSIERQLAGLSIQLETIQKKLGIEPLQKSQQNPSGSEKTLPPSPN